MFENIEKKKVQLKKIDEKNIKKEFENSSDFYLDLNNNAIYISRTKRVPASSQKILLNKK